MSYLIIPSAFIPRFPWGLSLRLPFPLTAAGQGMFADGRCLLFGGFNNGLTRTGMEAVTPLADTLVIAADGSSVTAAGALPQPLPGGISTLLGDGRILALATNGFAAYVQTIDPGTLVWTTQPAMLDNFETPALTTLSDGNALRIGGAISGIPSQSVEKYNRLTNTWTSKADLLNVHSSSSLKAATLPNGDVLVVSYTGDPEVYVPGTDTWHPTTNLPQPGNRCQTCVTLPNGKLFTCTSSSGFILVADVFDPLTRKFSPLASHTATHSQTTTSVPFPTGFYLGENLVAVMDVGLSPRAAFYDYKKNQWYEGGFDLDTRPPDSTESLGLTNLFYLGQYGFLTTGGTYTSAPLPLPHRSSYYTQMSILPRTPKQFPTFAGVVSVVQGTTDGSVFVEWDPASDAITAEEDFNYYVYGAIDPAPIDYTPGTELRNTEIWAGSLSREITGLAVATAYNFSVRVRNLRGRNEPGNYDTNTVVASFTTGSPGVPTFTWVATVPMREPRMGLHGAIRADGRFHVFGGFNAPGSVSPTGDIYSQNGLTNLPSDQGPSIAMGAALDESPEFFGGRHRPTVIGGTSNNASTAAEVLKNYPYTDNWFSNFDLNVDYGTIPREMNEAVAQHAAVALPFGDILRMGGTTSLYDSSTAVNTVERMFFRPRKVDYRAQTSPFTVGDTITGGSSGAQSKIISDTGMIYTFLRLENVTSDFVVGENVTGQLSGATGQVVIAALFQGARSLYLTIGGTPFTEGEQILGDVAGDATIQLSNFYSQTIVSPVGTLTVESLTDTAFNNFDSLTGVLGGDGFVSNHPLPFGPGPIDLAHGFQSWEFVAPMNRTRYTHTASLLDDGRVFVIGGQTIFGAPELTAEIYDVALDTWTLVTAVTPDVQALPYDPNRFPPTVNFVPGENITGQSSGATAVVVSDDGIGILVVNTVVGIFDLTEQILGDVAGDANLNGPLLHLVQPHYQCPNVKLLSGQILTIGGGSFYVALFTPGIDTLVLAASMDSVKTEHTAIRFGDGKVGVFGGRVSGVAVADVRLYDPALDSWSSPSDMLTPRCGHVSFLLPNNKALVVGGEDDTGNPTDLAELSS